MKEPLTLLILTVQLLAVHSEEILILQPFSPTSHKIIANTIAEALGLRNHHVTIVSPFNFEGTVPANVTEVVYPQFKSSFPVLQSIVVDAIRYGWTFDVFSRYFKLHSGLCEQFYESKPFQQWKLQKKKFRVVIIDCVFTECLLPLWRYFGESVIILNTAMLTPMITNILGLPTPYSIVPTQIQQFTHHMTFWQRFANVFYWAITNYVVELSQEVFYKDVILPNFPDVGPKEELLSNVSLVLVNEERVYSFPRPYLPNIILIGGIQCRPAKPLPHSNLTKFIDESGEAGFILVSFGSIINGDFMSEELLTTLLTAFSQIKQRVVWKYESKLNNLPDNVMTVDWFPQQDILGHPKLRAFINQGGLNTVHESLYNAVPQVCFPMVNDQPVLAATGSAKGIAIPLDFRTVSVDELVNAINKASYDPEMKKNVQYYSKIFRDRKEPPTETAVYWIEYVMKYNGAHHLQSAAKDLNIIQYYLLDVFALVLLIFASVAMLFWFMGRKIVKFFSRIMKKVTSKLKPKLE